jgi:AraC-like DNA-binding protein
MESNFEISYLPSDLEFRVVPFNDEVDYDSLKLHRHNYLEIFIFTKGGGKHLIDFNEYEIGPHQLHFVFPNQLHLVKRTNESQGFVILFKIDFLHMQLNNPMQAFYTRFFNEPVLDLQEDEFKVLENLFNLLKEEVGVQKDAYNFNMVRFYLNAMLIQSLRFHKKTESQGLTIDHSICNRFTQLLEDKYNKEKQVSFYISELSTTSKQLTNALNKVLGKSPKELISARVNLEIRRSLLYTDKSIKEISYEMGFNEPSHLTKFFVRMNNANPLEYRKKWVEKYNS